MLFHRTMITEYGKPDTSNSHWCRQALAFQVTNGMDKLKWTAGKEDGDYCYNSRLELNGKPLVQGYFPICPTCFGMLATGYGIENIDCYELNEIRETLNRDYRGIESAFSALKPFLGLLEDGYYLLADVELTPTDGAHFFYNVPNELTSYRATCDEYYNSVVFTTTAGFPAFMYPTQGAASISEDRVKEYREALKQDAEIRGLAYYEKGFICALLDGHHKAIAAAQLGMKLKCLTIIPVDGCTFENGGKRLPLRQAAIKAICFAGISLETKGLIEKDQLFMFRHSNRNVDIVPYTLTNDRFASMEDSIAFKYHTLEHLCSIYAYDLIDAEVTDEDIRHWISHALDEDRAKLKTIMEYRTISDYESAYHIAEMIIRSGNRNMPYWEAWQTLLRRKDAHTEELTVDYLIDHTPSDECWKLVSSYWDS